MSREITLILIELFVFSNCEWSEAFVIRTTENGWIKCNLSFCQINCDYGYITSGRLVFPKTDPDPTCNKTMAFIIGKFILFDN